MKMGTVYWHGGNMLRTPIRQLMLRITTISNEVGGMRLQWDGGVEAKQYLEGKTNLTDTGTAWFVIASNMPPTPTSTNYLVNSGTTNPIFYRIRVTR